MDYDILRKSEWYNATNAAWNKSGVNNPKNIGYLCDAVQRLEPKDYEEWDKYFKTNIADDEKLLQLAHTFKETVLNDNYLNRTGLYSYLTDKAFVDMTECRLKYDTWLGYKAEIYTISEVAKQLPGYDYKHLPPEDDNKYAVDYVLTKDGKDVCGIQVKSEAYKKSTRPVLLKTKSMNKKKNDLFTSTYKIPVYNVYYLRNPSLSIEQKSVDTVKDYLSKSLNKSIKDDLSL